MRLGTSLRTTAARGRPTISLRPDGGPQVPLPRRWRDAGTWSDTLNWSDAA